MAGRPTDEQKSETIKLRLTYRQMKYVRKLVISRDCTISEYIRELIDADMGEKGQK